jgi:copper homeostasis protein CutC
MQKLITTAHGLHTTAHPTINQLAATNPSEHLTALKKLDFTKPLNPTWKET